MNPVPFVTAPPVTPRYASAIGRRCATGPWPTTFAPRRAAAAALSGDVTPCQSGGCGCCTGAISIGTERNWKYRPRCVSVFDVSPARIDLERLLVDLAPRGS